MTERSVLVLVLTRLPSVRFAPCFMRDARCALSAHRRPPIGIAGAQYRPGDARDLRCQGDGGDLDGSARHDALEPATGVCRFYSGPARQIGGTEHQQSSQTVIALAADVTDAGLLGAAVGQRRQADPSGAVARAGEAV